MYKIRREGKYIVVNIEQGGVYVPVMFFDGISRFHRWAKNIGIQVGEMCQLCDEIEKIYKDVFTEQPKAEPKGEVWDYVNKLEKIDGLTT
jgi:hypothetical protein